jgi:transposase-like protein
VPRVCTVCTHAKRAEIDAALLSGEPYRRVAQRYGTSATALHRHREHIPSQLVKAREVAEAVEAGTLLDRLKAINAETRAVPSGCSAILEDAKAARNSNLRLLAIARLEKQLELEATLLGELQSGPVVNLTVSPEWLAIRARLLHPIQRPRGPLHGL